MFIDIKSIHIWENIKGDQAGYFWNAISCRGRPNTTIISIKKHEIVIYSVHQIDNTTKCTLVVIAL